MGNKAYGNKKEETIITGMKRCSKTTQNTQAPGIPQAGKQQQTVTAPIEKNSSAKKGRSLHTVVCGSEHSK
jgi:hypothetical protein